MEAEVRADEDRVGAREVVVIETDRRGGRPGDSPRELVAQEAQALGFSGSKGHQAQQREAQAEQLDFPP